jgi:L-iditol 2-dehydrogenase
MRGVISREGSVRCVDIDEPSTNGLDEVVVEVTSAGICGSDLHLVANGLADVVLGHEFGGRLPDGTLVAVRPTGVCGTCASCLRGSTNLCRDASTALYGVSSPGGLAERVAVERSRLIELPPSIDPSDVALIEPLAVVVHAVRRASPAKGDRVLVVGAGSIGLLAVAALRHRDIEVDVVTRHGHQGEIARALGAGTTPGRNYDVVIDAVGSQSAVDEAVLRCRHGGTIVEVGMFWDPVALGLPILMKEISLVPSMYYVHGHEDDDFAEAVRVLADGPDLASLVVTHRFVLEDAAQAFATAADRASGAVKVHLHT